MSGGLEATTLVQVREVLREALLVEATPLTGRKHQVRVHLAGAGMPILGDPVYGGSLGAAPAAVPRLMLHARRLELKQPLSGVGLLIQSPLPPDFVNALTALRSRQKSGAKPPGPIRPRRRSRGPGASAP